MIETTDDAFLGGRLTLRQPRSGYRAGVDPVLLAASVKAKAGESVLELGCGVGTALLCLAARIEGLTLHGVEIQPELAALARHNLDRNGMSGQITVADIEDLPEVLRQKSFHQVIANPPFFDRSRGSAASDAGRDTGRGGETPLASWVDMATKRLMPRGYLTIIQRAERLPELLRCFDERLGDIRVRPLASRIGRDAELIIVSARKGARGEARLAAPVILHDGPKHEGDGDSYSAHAKAVLRDGAPL